MNVMAKTAGHKAGDVAVARSNPTAVRPATKDREPTVTDVHVMRAEYEDVVNRCAALDLSFELSNRHTEHAGLLYNAALKYTRDYMEILTGTMPELFLSTIKAELVNALNRGVKVTIAVIDPADKGPAELAELAKHHKNFHLLVLRKEYRSEFSKKVAHFYVSDGRRIRLEDIHEPRRDFVRFPEIRATANFNAPDIGHVLHDSFEAIRPLCDEIRA